MRDCPMIGKTISHYKILEKLGEGGMGVVYKAEDTKLNRPVALKFLPPGLTGDEEAKTRFVREAQTASTLQHNNICAIHEIDETEDGRLFISMDWYKGETLRARIAKGAVSFEESIDIIAQASDGLSVAHEVGIVHRDIKPANILVTDKGVVKILDFGLAKLAGASKVTKTGTTLGTVAYMSPEQVRGEEADARSDIWSLSVVLYELLTGVLPFRGDHEAAIMYGIMHADPDPVAAHGMEVSSEIQDVLNKGLEKKADNRYQNSASLSEALRGGSALSDGHEEPSVAVFPFVSIGRDEESDFLCEGLAEEIITALTRIPGLRVIARTSSFMVGRMGLDIRDAGRRLGVGGILEGSVRRQGRRVRVSAQLVSTHDGTQVWSERYDREMTDMLVLEDEIAEAICERLSVRLTRHDKKRDRVSVNIEAHTAFLEGRYFFARGTPEALAKAKECFEKAIEMDPGSALAFDSLAELYWYMGFFGGVQPREAFSMSMWHAMRALELDDTLAETHALLAMLRKELDYNWSEVDRELRKAMNLNPDSPLVRLRYAISGLLPRARIAEAAAQMEFVVRADPLSIFVRWWSAVMLFLSGQFGRMIEESRHMISLDPTHFLGHWTLGMGLDGTGECADAVAALDKAHELSGGSPFTLGFLAYGMGRAGRAEDARTLLEQASRAAKEGYLPPSVFVLGHAGLEEWDAVFHWLGETIDVRDPMAMPMKTFPFLAPVRSDPRYRALLHKMNL